jgi:hypothetical protein
MEDLMAAIGIWFLGFLSYGGYMLYMFRRPADIYLIIGIAALIIGFISFAVDKKFLMIASLVIMFGGIALTYPIAIAREAVWPFVGGLAAMLFFGSISLR